MSLRLVEATLPTERAEEALAELVAHRDPNAFTTAHRRDPWKGIEGRARPLGGARRALDALRKEEMGDGGNGPPTGSA